MFKNSFWPRRHSVCSNMNIRLSVLLFQNSNHSVAIYLNRACEKKIAFQTFTYWLMIMNVWMNNVSPFKNNILWGLGKMKEKYRKWTKLCLVGIHLCKSQRWKLCSVNVTFFNSKWRNIHFGSTVQKSFLSVKISFFSFSLNSNAKGHSSIMHTRFLIATRKILKRNKKYQEHWYCKIKALWKGLI